MPSTDCRRGRHQPVRSGRLPLNGCFRGLPETSSCRWPTAWAVSARVRTILAALLLLFSLAATVLLALSPDVTNAGSLAAIVVVVPTFGALAVAILQGSRGRGDLVDRLVGRIEAQARQRRADMLGSYVVIDLLLVGTGERESIKEIGDIAARVGAACTSRLVLLGDVGGGKSFLVNELVLTISNLQQPLKALVATGLLTKLPQGDSRRKFYMRNPSAAWEWAAELSDQTRREEDRTL